MKAKLITSLLCLIAFTTLHASVVRNDFGTRVLKAFTERAKLQADGLETASKPTDSKLEMAEKLLFIENGGQVKDTRGALRPDILFTAQMNGTKVYVTSTSIHYVFAKVSGSPKPDFRSNASLLSRIEAPRTVELERITVNLKGANPAARLVKQVANAYFENYYLPQCPNGVKARSYEQFTLEGVYPGVDWVIYSNGQGLKYDFKVKEARLANQIKLEVVNASSQVSANGDLLLNAKLGSLKEKAPVSFQNGQVIPTKFVAEQPGVYSFILNDVQPSAPLTIDPSVEWGTYYGGNVDESEVVGNAIDYLGNVFMTGLTWASDFPATSNYAYQGRLPPLAKAFLVKLSNTGSRKWASMYGGENIDYGRNVSVDKLGNAYLIGSTSSRKLPLKNAHQDSLKVDFFGGRSFTVEGFLLKLDTSGAMEWGTFIGGTLLDFPMAVNVDSKGNVAVTGITNSADFPLFNPIQSRFNLLLPSQIPGPAFVNSIPKDLFISLYSPNGVLKRATFFGGGHDETAGSDIAFDSHNNMYIAGTTSSIDFPVFLPNSTLLSTASVLNSEPFVLKLDSNWSVKWCVQIGGDKNDIANSCALDRLGNLIVGGETRSNNFPVLGGGFTTLNSDSSDGFAFRLSPLGQLQYSTKIGGSDFDGVYEVAVDTLNHLTLIGTTESPNLPVMNAVQSAISNHSDAFAAKIFYTGALAWCTYYGGSSYDNSFSGGIDNSGDVFVIGNTSSPNLQMRNSIQSGNGLWLVTPFIVKLDYSGVATNVTSVGSSVRTTVVNLTLAPNPATAEVAIMGLSEELTPYTLINNLGQVVRRGKASASDNKIPLQGLRRGLYTVATERDRLRLVVE